jgi:hypothetical protein
MKRGLIISVIILGILLFGSVPGALAADENMGYSALDLSGATGREILNEIDRQTHDLFGEEYNIRM